VSARHPAWPVPGRGGRKTPEALARLHSARSLNRSQGFTAGCRGSSLAPTGRRSFTEEKHAREMERQEAPASEAFEVAVSAYTIDFSSNPADVLANLVPLSDDPETQQRIAHMRAIYDDVAARPAPAGSEESEAR